MIRRRPTSLAVLLAATTVCGGQAAAPTKSPASADTQPLPPLDVVQTQAFSGPEGLVVRVVDLRDDSAFVQVSGARSELAGRVVRARVQTDGPYLQYHLTWRGRGFNILVRDRSTGVPAERAWKTYIPDAESQGVVVTYDEALSEAVDVEALHRLHVEQTADGTLAKITDFDRAAEQADERASLEELDDRMHKECGGHVPIEVAWDTVSDERLLDRSISNYCGSLYSAFRNVCRFEAGRRFVQTQVKSAQCRFDGDQALTLDGGRMVWAIDFEGSNLSDRARDALLALEQPSGTSLQQEIHDEDTVVCTDSTGEHVVMYGPEDAAHGGMAYGSGKSLFKIPPPWGLGRGWFFDPRQYNPKRNSNFRGHDLRLYSYVEADAEQGTCTLTCGTRDVELRLLDGDAKADALRGVTYQPSPHGRRPYALARDRRGVYYYVDQGVTEDTQRDFRLYRGQRGRMKPLVMRDVVSDSEGEIFASQSGKLRLVVEKSEALWIDKTRTKLQRVPLEDNYPLIYNELGVYLAERLGVPCDDL